MVPLLQQAQCGRCCARLQELALLKLQQRPLHNSTSWLKKKLACGTEGPALSSDKSTSNLSNSKGSSNSSGSGSGSSGVQWGDTGCSGSRRGDLHSSSGLHRSSSSSDSGSANSANSLGSNSRSSAGGGSSFDRRSCRSKALLKEIDTGWAGPPAAAAVRCCWPSFDGGAVHALAGPRLFVRCISLGGPAALGCRGSDSSNCVGRSRNLTSSCSSCSSDGKNSSRSTSSSSSTGDEVSSCCDVCGRIATRGGWRSSCSSRQQPNGSSRIPCACGSTNDGDGRLMRDSSGGDRSSRTHDLSRKLHRAAAWGYIHSGRYNSSAASSCASSECPASSSSSCQPSAADRWCPTDARSIESDAFNLCRGRHSSGSSTKGGSVNMGSRSINSRSSSNSSSLPLTNSSSGSVQDSNCSFHSSITNSGSSIGSSSEIVGIISGLGSSSCSSADIRSRCSSMWHRGFCSRWLDSGSSFALGSCDGGLSGSSSFVGRSSSSLYTHSIHTLSDCSSSRWSPYSSRNCCGGLSGCCFNNSSSRASEGYTARAIAARDNSRTAARRVVGRPSICCSSTDPNNAASSSCCWSGGRQCCSNICSGMQTDSSSTSVSSRSSQRRWFSARPGASRMKWYVVKRYTAKQQLHRVGDSYRFPPPTLRRSWAPQLPQPTVDWRYGEPDDTYSWPASAAAGAAAGGGKQQQRQVQQLPAELQHTIEVVGLPMGRTPEYLQERLWRYFNKFGIVERVRVLPHPLDPYQTAGTAYVSFRSRMASLRAVRLPIYLPASLHNRVLQLRHLGTDKTSDFSFYRRMRQAIANTLFVAKQLYNLLEREGPTPLPKALRSLFERSYPRLAWRQAGYSIRATCGSWLNFFSQEPINEIFFLASTPQPHPASPSSSSSSSSSSATISSGDTDSGSSKEDTRNRSGSGKADSRRSSSVSGMMEGMPPASPVSSATRPSPVSSAASPTAATTGDALAAGTGDAGVAAAAGRRQQRYGGAAREFEGLVVYPHLLRTEKLQQLLLRAGRVLQQQLQQQLSVHWRTDRPPLPDWTRQQVDAWQHKPPLPEELQIWSRTKDYYKIQEERFLFKLKLKKERVKAKMELKEQRRRQLLQEQQQHTTQQQGSSARSFAAGIPGS